MNDAEWRDVVVEDPEVLGGTPVIKGTRIPVYLIAAEIEAGTPVAQILKSYPGVKEWQVEAASSYARAVPPRGAIRQKAPKVGIPSREAYKKRTLAIAKELHVPSKDDEPKVWLEFPAGRLRPAALEIFIKVMHAWKAPGIESRQLLGVARGMKIDKLDPEMLSDEQLLRISYLVEIYKGLHTYWGEEMAVRWVGTRTTNALFAGKSPLEYMARGGLDALRIVRKIVDAWCAEKN
jgi:uncharacterized protein (DUF433 family)